MNLLRKLVALVTTVVLLWALLVPAGTTGQLWALVVPILLLAGLVAVVSKPHPSDDPELPLFQFAPVLASRAPPSC